MYLEVVLHYIWYIRDNYLNNFLEALDKAHKEDNSINCLLETYRLYRTGQWLDYKLQLYLFLTINQGK